MMKTTASLLLACLLPAVLPAQQDIPLLRPEERKAVDVQTREFNEALKPALAAAAKSTVRVWAGKRRLAYGTVVDDGHKVLTKFSELVRANGVLRVEAGDGAVRPVTVTGVYQDEDIALLTIQGDPLTPAKWYTEEPKLGSFLAAPQPGGQPAAFGVVSVMERNLRETDKAYLGVLGDIAFAGPGVRIQEVKADSGAAAAGLKEGDVILKVNNRTISGPLELRNALIGLVPGKHVTMSVTRGKKSFDVDILLGNRPEMPQVFGDRLRVMEQMGGPISRVRDSFSMVIQTDMRPAPDQIGGPVVDLQGRVVGITVARADRTRSYVMPSATLIKLLGTEPVKPELAKAAMLDRRGRPSGVSVDGLPPDMLPADEARLRRHRDDIMRLMERMQEEMMRLDEMNR